MSGETRTLLTGFGPFGEVVDNPTERLVRHFGDSGAQGHRLTTCVLPVSYRRAPALLRDAIEQGDADGRPFDLVWMLGVASRSQYWRVERLGRNVNDQKPDMDGVIPPVCVVEDGPDTLAVTVPVSSVTSALSEAGVPAAVSDSAGGYLCNHALYAALQYLRQTGHPATAGFLHVPVDPATLAGGESAPACFSFAQHIRAVEISLDALRVPAAGTP
jgi:pyroglutamyl-peptidase